MQISISNWGVPHAGRKKRKHSHKIFFSKFFRTSTIGTMHYKKDLSIKKGRERFGKVEKGRERFEPLPKA